MEEMTSVFFKSTLLVITLVCYGCATDPYNPDRFLSEKEQAQLIRNTVYYTAKLTPNANHETKFYPEHAGYYDRAALETDLRKYYVDSLGTHYFLMTRVARSITPMREAIGGKLSYDENGKMVTYEEVFRTWKQPDDTLRVRSAKLFVLMVEGKDLTPYYSKYQSDKYIEFPDDRFYFDKAQWKWKDRELDSLIFHDKQKSF